MAARAPRSTSGITRDWMVALLVGLAAAISGTALEAPFRRMFEGSGQFFAAVASVHLERGLAFTKGHDWVRNADNPYDWRGADPDEARAYAHHPPGLGLSLAAWFTALGASPAVARLATLAMHLAGVLLVVATVRRFAEPHEPFAAFFTGLFYVGAPVAGYFGRHVCHEAWVTPALVLAVAAYLPRLERGGDGTAREDAVVCAGMAVAAFFDWPGLYLVPILVALEALRGRLLGRSARRFLAAGVATGAVLVAHLAWATGFSGIDTLADGAVKRISPGTYGLELAPWTAKVGSFFRDDFTAALLVAAGAAIAWSSTVRLGALLRSGREATAAPAPRVERLGPMGGWVAIWLALGTVHVIAFPSGSFVHPYWLWYLLPGLATAGGIALARLWRPRGALLVTAAGRALAVLVLFAFACESYATLNRWYDVARFGTGSPWMDAALPPLVADGCALCVPGFAAPQPAPGFSRSGV